MLLGSEAMQRLANAKVIVFGVGGVGGYVVEVLARSGVGAITMVDADCVCATNINRQIVALRSTIGKPKVEVAQQRIADINPDCTVKALKMFYLPENADDINLADYDYVVDCIDTMKAKLELIYRCHELNVPIICSMGAANKLDPTAFRVADITKTKMDPLARTIRKKLRERGINHLKVVYSEEQPLSPKLDSFVPGECEYRNLCPEADECGKPSSRRVVPASNAFVPAAAGLVVGGEVVKDLQYGDDYKNEIPPVDRGRQGGNNTVNL